MSKGLADRFKEVYGIEVVRSTPTELIEEIAELSRELKGKMTILASIPKNYRLVYQGGHHDVYCNKVDHIITTEGGGFCHAPIDRNEAQFIRRKFPCDCSSYQSRAC